MHSLHFPKVRKTNLNTVYKVDVKADRSSPVMEVKFSKYLGFVEFFLTSKSHNSTASRND